MIIDKLIAIPAKNRYKQHYLDLGYVENNGEFLIRPQDLLRYSRYQETRICDICGKNFTRRHEHHEKTNECFGMDICGDCVRTNKAIRQEIQNKTMAAWLEKYGDHPMRTQEVRDKVYNTYLKKYNGHPMHNPDIRDKWESIVQDKYGGRSPLCDEEVREKATATLSRLGKIPTSTQQEKIYSCLEELYPKCEVQLNFPVSKVSLDVLLIKDGVSIDIEYDGKHWHKDKQDYDRRRDEFLKSLGYKILRIKSAHKVPSPEELHAAIEDLINSSHSYSELILSDW